MYEVTKNFVLGKFVDENLAFCSVEQGVYAGVFLTKTDTLTLIITKAWLNKLLPRFYHKLPVTMKG